MLFMLKETEIGYKIMRKYGVERERCKMLFHTKFYTKVTSILRKLLGEAWR